MAINAWALWVDANREAGRADPLPIGPALGAARTIGKWAKDDAQLKDIFKAYLADRNPWLTDKGHGIQFLFGRIEKYRNTPPAHEDTEW